MSHLLKKVLLLVLTAFTIFYIIIAGVNLGLRLTQTRQPQCNPLFCKQIINEASYCLLSTPGAQDCLKVAGWFFSPSLMLAYLLLFITFGVALLISQKFYLSRWWIVLGVLAIGTFLIRVMLGAASLTPYGVLFEFQKLGLSSFYIYMFSK